MCVGTLPHDASSSTSFIPSSFTRLDYVNWFTPPSFIVSLLAFFVSTVQPRRALCDYKKSDFTSSARQRYHSLPALGDDNKWFNTYFTPSA